MIMKDTTFTAVDFETATAKRMICQVGIVVVKDGQIIHEESHLIQPPGNIYEQNTINIHGINPEETASSDTFDIVWEKIKVYFENTTIVSHNKHFDEDALYKNLDYYGIMPMGLAPFECTRELFGGYGLADLCKAFGMPCDHHHEALFDARCCAQFYLNYLNGLEPDYTLLPEKKRKSKIAEKHEKYRGDILKKDLSKADPSNPFYDRKVVITGEFDMPRLTLGKLLKQMGADLNTSISKKTNIVIVGEDPGPAKMEKLEKLQHDGFSIKILSQNDLNEILSGNWENYQTEKDVKKELDLTYDHYLKHHLSFENGYNIIAGKELFYGKGFSGNFDLFNQITGNLGAAGDTFICPETNICILSDSTIEKLSIGEKDETIKDIEDYYNNNKSIIFDFDFLSESDILVFCKERCEKFDDEVTMELYEKYMESGIKKQERQSKYKFEDGKNYVKVDGKYVLKLEDGRTWCPSRQFR